MSEKLKAMVGEQTARPEKKSDKIRHFKNMKRSNITTTDFLLEAPEKFFMDFVGIGDQKGMTWTVRFKLEHKTDACLTYIASLHDLRELYMAPVYIFKKECGFQKRMMERAYNRTSGPAYQVISPTVFESQKIWGGLRKAYEEGTLINPDALSDVVYTERKYDVFSWLLMTYIGFGYHQPIP